MNPGPPAPQAGVISEFAAFKRANKSVLDDEPSYAEYNKQIIKTLQQMASDERKRATVKSATWTLRELNRHADLMNPYVFVSCSVV